MDLQAIIRVIPNWPKEGVMFQDITTILQDPEAFKYCVDTLADFCTEQGATSVLGIESRGFIFGAAIAYKLGLKFAPIRKPGKLPWKTVSQEYELEYGTDKIEMHVDAIAEGERVLIIDDLLATGGTGEAAAKLVEQVGGVVAGIGFVIELTGSLHGREKLTGYNVCTLVEIEVAE
ncbi:MAG TPA: adenine phosphoribosyltransferase [Candidatus Lokiarchaeia archaeon]|nr:adenine phosphoribosyltransferase [Candidatus Lokiarchaeia archaeon]